MNMSPPYEVSLSMLKRLDAVIPCMLQRADTLPQRILPVGARAYIDVCARIDKDLSLLQNCRAVVTARRVGDIV
jgi:hypothetical protein